MLLTRCWLHTTVHPFIHRFTLPCFLLPQLIKSMKTSLMKQTADVLKACQAAAKPAKSSKKPTAITEEEEGGMPHSRVTHILAAPMTMSTDRISQSRQLRQKRAAIELRCVHSFAETPGCLDHNLPQSSKHRLNVLCAEPCCPPGCRDPMQPSSPNTSLMFPHAEELSAQDKEAALRVQLEAGTLQPPTLQQFEVGLLAIMLHGTIRHTSMVHVKCILGPLTTYVYA